MKNLLFIAFQYPPFGGGSGVHRVTRFARYLPQHQWRPQVITAATKAYEFVQESKAADAVPPEQLNRAFCLDAQRHLSFRGRYPRFFALPDRWVSWTLGAVPMGLSLIYRKKIDVILVTFPIATTVLIGLILQWLSAKPLVVDFRDSMTEEGYPRDPLARRVSVWIERQLIRRGAHFIFTTPSSRRMYLERYPSLDFANCTIIANGFDEEDFSDLGSISQQASEAKSCLRLVHSGIIYPDDRDPRAFFKAIRRLKETKLINAATARIELRACGSESYYRPLLEELGIQDVVHLLPSIPHRQALQDLAGADGLLLLQAASCDHQIPAKVYEYLRIGKPILALTSAAGDTAALLRETGGATIVDLANEEAIYAALAAFLNTLRAGTHTAPDHLKVQTYTRREGARQLAAVLDSVLGFGLADPARYAAR